MYCVLSSQFLGSSVFLTFFTFFEKRAPLATRAHHPNAPANPPTMVLKAPRSRVQVWYECADGCKHQESCSCGTVAVWQELCFQLLVSVQHQTALSNLHANGGMQVST
jgi:hypothetical protein